MQILEKRKSVFHLTGVSTGPNEFCPSYFEGHLVSILNASNTLLLNCPVTMAWILTASAAMLGLSPIYITSIVVNPSVILNVRVLFNGSHLSVPGISVPLTVIGGFPAKVSRAATASLTSYTFEVPEETRRYPNKTTTIATPNIKRFFFICDLGMKNDLKQNIA